MDPATIAALAATGVNFVSNLIGSNKKEKAEQAAAQQAAAQNAQNIALQKEFAQNAIQWKAADAQKAGIHPLYALGANTVSFSPVSVGATASSAGDNFRAMGQDLSRGIMATGTAAQRSQAAAVQVTELGMEREKLTNDLLRAQIASVNARTQKDQVGPPFPTIDGTNFMVPGQVDSGLVKPKALEVAPGDPSAPYQEGGSITDTGFARTRTGYWPIPSKDVKERIEDNFPYELEHYVRNRLVPSLGGHMNSHLREPFPPPAGKEWFYHYGLGEYQLHDFGQRPRFTLRVRGGSSHPQN